MNKKILLYKVDGDPIEVLVRGGMAEAQEIYDIFEYQVDMDDDYSRVEMKEKIKREEWEVIQSKTNDKITAPEKEE